MQNVNGIKQDVSGHAQWEEVGGGGWASRGSRSHLLAVLLSNTLRPHRAQVCGTHRVGHVSTFDEHALDQRPVLWSGQLLQDGLVVEGPG